MPIPDFQSLMLPILTALADGKEAESAAIRARIAASLRLSESDLTELLPSGKQGVFLNRIAWGISHMFRAGVMTRVRRGTYQITERGQALLATKPVRIDMGVLSQFPEYVAWRTKESLEGEQPETAASMAAPETPRERIDAAYLALRSNTESELLELVLQSPPAFFEGLVVDLLVKMGYGGSEADAGRAIGRSGDEGLDGVIKEDRLGLDLLYVQAKRWAPDRTVGRPDIQAFAGSLDGARARKGVFLTTARFTKEARAYVDQIEKRIVLIDGAQLSALMFDFEIGVTPERAYAVKRIDNDYFSDE